MNKPFKHILIATYAHPELYPPILSAISQLTHSSERIDIVTRRMLQSKWAYPNNVKLNYINKASYTGFEIEQITFWKKVRHFMSFVRTIKKIIKDSKTEWLIVHDSIPLFAAYLLRHTLKSHGTKLWYHNHDVVDVSKAGKYSLMGLSARFEKNAFHYIYLFTLPAKERLSYFPVELLNRPPIILPNYPLKAFYQSKTSSVLESKIKLVFQGSIGAGHGLEAIIPLLAKPIFGKQLELHLVGKIRLPYLNSLNDLVSNYGVKDYFFYHGMQPFAELPEFLTQFDVGLAIHQPYNLTYATGGTASNKIYEYAACGFPVILFDNEHYRDYLGAFNWTYFTDLSEASLISVFTEIIKSYTDSSLAARKDFELKFNFETAFEKYVKPVLY